MDRVIINDSEKDCLSYQLFKNLYMSKDFISHTILKNLELQMDETSNMNLFGLPKVQVELSLNHINRSGDINDLMILDETARYKKIVSEIIPNFIDLKLEFENHREKSYKVFGMFRNIQYFNDILVFELERDTMEIYSYSKKEYKNLNMRLLEDSYYSFQLDRYISQMWDRDIHSFTIKIKDLREMFNLSDDSYKSFYDFERFVLDRAIEFINGNYETEYDIYYEKVRKGRRIDEIMVTLEAKREELQMYDIEEKAKSFGYLSAEEFVAENALEDLKLTPSMIKSIFISIESGISKYKLLELNKDNINHLVSESKVFADTTKTKDAYIVHLTNVIKEDRANAMLEKYMEILES